MEEPESQSNRRESHILVVTPMFPPCPGGWPAPFMEQTVRQLQVRGHSVKVQVFDPFRLSSLRLLSDCKEKWGSHSETFEVSRSLRWPTTYPFLRTLTAPANRRSIIAKVREWLAERSASGSSWLTIIVHSEYMLAPILQVRDESCRIVLVIHGVNSRLDRLGPLPKEEIQAVDAAVIVGAPLRGYAQEELGIDSARIRLVWNGAGVNAGLSRSPRIGKGNCLRILDVGNLEREKGHHILIRALGLCTAWGLVDWSLTIIGSGPEGHYLRRLARECGIGDKVEFLGSLPNGEVLEIMSSKDLFVLPSYREAFGVVYAEAMRTGLLTVGVAGQGPSGFIRHGETGLLCEPDDVDSLAGLLQSILQEPRRREWNQMARRGQDYANQYLTWDAHGESLDMVLESLHREPSHEAVN